MNEYPNFYIVGEEWVDDPSLISYWQKDKVNKDGYTSCLPALMDFPLCFALHKAMNEKEGWGDGLIKLYEKLGQDFNYANPSNMVVFPDNHDMSRIYTQVNENFNLYKMALTFILTTRGIPQLYYGTEIAMSNKGTDSHGIIRSDFPGGWQGDGVSIKDNVGLDSLQLAALSFNKKILNWRKDKTVIHHGKLMHFEPKEKVYVYFRYDDKESVMVILNKNHASYHLKLNRFKERLEGFNLGKDVLSGTEFFIKDSITIEPVRSYVLELEK